MTESDRTRRSSPARAGPAADARKAAPTGVSNDAAGILRLQGAIGNQAVLRMLADPATGGREAPLPPDVQQEMTRRSGLELDDVVVHHDSPRPAEVGAEAYAYGRDIHLGPGRSEHVAHEAWHVVQQRQGRVPATPTAAGIGVNTDPALERDADRQGSATSGSAPTGPVLQGVFTRKDLAELQQMSPTARLTKLVLMHQDDWDDLVDQYGRLVFRSKREIDLVLHLRERYELRAAEHTDEDDGDDEAADGDDEPAGRARPGTHGRRKRGRATYDQPTSNVGDAMNDPSRRGEPDSRVRSHPDAAFNDDDAATSYGDTQQEAAAAGRPSGRTGIEPPFGAWAKHAGVLGPKVTPGGRGRADAADAGGLDERRVDDDDDLEDEVIESGGDAAVASFESDDAGSPVTEEPDLRVSFLSEVDGGTEQHAVYPDQPLTHESKVWVESNPETLKSILNAKSWLGRPLPQATWDALVKLSPEADTAIATFATTRSASNAGKIATVLRKIAAALKKAFSLKDMPDTNLGQSDYHGSSSSDVEGSHVRARPLSLNAGGYVGSAPQADSRLMKAIRARANADDPPQSKSYKEMHLLNDNLFGPGQPWNLTPGPAASNSQMERDVETPLKRAILDHALVINFEAKVKYRKDPNNQSNEAAIRANPDLYRFEHITFAAEQLEPDGSKRAATQHADVQAVNKAKVQWDYGSLRPLVPKARIRHGTTKDELVASRVPEKIAERIVAFFNDPANKNTVFKDANKKDQLYDALKAHAASAHNSSAFKGWDDWKATDVVW